MIENLQANASSDGISALDMARYLSDLSGELAKMAGTHGLSRLAAALELSHSLAAEAIASLVDQPVGNAAPDDAA